MDTIQASSLNRSFGVSQSNESEISQQQLTTTAAGPIPYNNIALRESLWSAVDRFGLRKCGIGCRKVVVAEQEQNRKKATSSLLSHRLCGVRTPSMISSIYWTHSIAISVLIVYIQVCCYREIQFNITNASNDTPFGGALTLRYRETSVIRHRREDGCIRRTALRRHGRWR